MICGSYDSSMTTDRLHAVPSLLLVDVERAASNEFITLARALHAVDRLNRIVLDESHLPSTAAHYRHQLGVDHQSSTVNPFCPGGHLSFVQFSDPC